VTLALEAAEVLSAQGKNVQVVSMPCTTVFDAQDSAYQESVLPIGVKRFAIEAATKDFWYKYVGLEGGIIGMSSFGESAPAGELFKHFGISSAALVALVEAKL
ncbi:MAG: transketolase, partial [Reinekea forsetii]|nr:transketolase [Reinekea forsetii]